MTLVFSGDPKHYSKAVVLAFVYERSGKYEPLPLFICECVYSDQFTKEELISDISMRAGIQSMFWDDIKPDIRKIHISYED